MGLRFLASGLLLMIVPDIVLAQASPVPTSGDILRVYRESDPKSPIKVVLLAVRSDSLIAKVFAARDTLSIALPEVSRLELRSGVKSRWLFGAGVGGGAGLLAGGIFGFAAASGQPDNEPLRIAGPLVGLVLGGLTGALIGSFIKTDRWTSIEVDRVHVSLATGHPGSLGLVVTRRF